MDINKDNMLTLEEILEFYDDKYEMKLTKMFDKADKAHNGYVTKEQFSTMKQ